MDTFEKHARLLKPKPLHAQILLELDEGGETLDKALGVLRREGVEPSRVKTLRKKHPARVLLELSSRDMREAVLRLSEAGFFKVRGVNALQTRPGPERNGSGERA